MSSSVSIATIFIIARGGSVVLRSEVVDGLTPPQILSLESKKSKHSENEKVHLKKMIIMASITHSPFNLSH